MKENYDEAVFCNYNQSIFSCFNKLSKGEKNFDLLILLFADADQFSKGDYIEAWIDDAMMDSYPPQVNAEQVEIKE